MTEQFNLSEKILKAQNVYGVQTEADDLIPVEDIKTFIQKLKDRIAGEISYAEPNIKKWKIEEIIDTLAGEELTQNHSPRKSSVYADRPVERPLVGDNPEETHGKLKESLPKPSGSQNQKEKSEEWQN